MVTSLLVFEAGEVKREAVEVTYRTLTYYFDDSIAKIVDASLPIAKPVESPLLTNKSVEKEPTELTNHPESGALSTNRDNPPPEISKPETKNTASPIAAEPHSEPIAAEPHSEKEAAGMQVNASALTTPANAGAPEAEKTSVPARNELDEATGSNRESNPIASVVSAANSPATSGSSAEIRENNPPTDKQKSALEYHKTGLALFEAGGLQAAVNAYLMSLSLEPNSAEVYLSLAHAYLKLKKDNDAVKAFKESIRIKPDVPEAYYGLGLVYFHMHRNKDAADAFKRAINLNPGMGKAHYGLALAYQELGKQDGLLEEYRILQGLDRNLAKQLSQSFQASSPPCSAGPFCN
jgi:Tfp pilus assembly protein PilF